MGVLLNADVLEVIAEYACATVTDACALRAANKGHRRAVDTTVRRWAYEDQPDLSVDRSATLHIHHGAEHLDAVRIAFTCDAFKNIARLVVVAFALDGAKDELHEGGECGPRPVSAWEHPPIVGTPFSKVDSVERAEWRAAVGWNVIAGSHSSAPRRAFPSFTFLRCSTVVALSAAAHVDACHALLSASDGGPPQLPHIVRLECSAAGTASPSFPQVLVALGPQLTHLAFEIPATGLPAALCSAIVACTRLTHVFVAVVAKTPVSAVRTEGLCNALIASGAPLESVRLDADPHDAARVLHAAAAHIAEASVVGLSAHELPPAAAARLRWFNNQNVKYALPRLERIRIPLTGGAAPAVLGSSQFAMDLDVRALLSAADVASAFPQLRSISLNGVADDVAVGDLRFPPTLTELSYDEPFDTFSDGHATAIVRCLAERQLPRLTSVRLFQCPVDVDLAPLATAYSATLTSVTLEFAGMGVPVGQPHVGALEAALAQLTNLTRADLDGLPNARCFLGGRHRQLRELCVASIHDPPLAPFAKLARACPRLVAARSSCAVVIHPGDDDDATPALPQGWVGDVDVQAGGPTRTDSLRRASFTV